MVGLFFFLLWDDFSCFQNVSPDFVELSCAGGLDKWSRLQDCVALEAELTAAGAGPEWPGDTANVSISAAGASSHL